MRPHSCTWAPAVPVVWAVRVIGCTAVRVRSCRQSLGLVLASCAALGAMGCADAATPPAPIHIVEVHGLIPFVGPVTRVAMTMRAPPEPNFAVPSVAIPASVGRGVLQAARRSARTQPRRATLAFTGDTLVHSPIVQQAWINGGGVAFDFAPMFARIAPAISDADLAVCHLETPVAPPGEQLSTAPRYGIPAEIAGGIAAAGYDRCSTASNHSLDRGVGGIEATVGALESVGVAQVGMARRPEESVAAVVTVEGIGVAQLSYTWSFNGLRLAPEEWWRSNLIDPERIVADAIDARARGADAVIVSLHWGVERSAVPSTFQRDVAAELTASGAIDLIVGHHAHVLQPIEMVNGRWVVFGLGNFLSNMPTGDSWPASSQDGAVVTVTIERHPDGSVAVGQPAVIPTWVDRSGGFMIRPVIADLADPAVSDVIKAELAASLERTTALLGAFIV